ncbi:MAG: hypothetical protein HY820_39780 [Acidobacteria bacterium]|nr:hypothetical protein [Acidobacteriota bacterium]
MRKLILLGCLSGLGLFAQSTQDLADLAWISGHWGGPVGRAYSEESWLVPKGNAMLGLSRTMVGERMVAFEFLRIEKRADGIYYVAQPNGRPPTDFKLTKSTSTLAVFENPKHDHPKIITYEIKESGTLVATIEGDERGQHKKQAFTFQRLADPVKK